MNRQYFYAISILVGTIVGIGIFGVPFSFAKAGIITGIFLLVILAMVNILINLAYGEIALRTNGNHQITGYAEIYLGSKWKKVLLFSFSLVIYTALLAYIIISGEFLSNIFSITPITLSPFTFSTIFFIFASLLVLSGLKNISWFELFMSIALGAVILVVAGMGIPKINFGEMTLFRKEFFFLPYGVLLFALRGITVIPVQRELLEGREEWLKRAIFWGTIIPAVIYLIFAFVVVGISGDATTPEAVSGLLQFLGFPVVFFLSIFGILAITTSFLGLGLALNQVFAYDFHFSKLNSWMLVIVPPYILFFMGVRSFIDVISLGGAVALGVESIILIFLYQKIKAKGQRIPEYSLNIPVWIWYALITMFSLGIIYALFF